MLLVITSCRQGLDKVEKTGAERSGPGIQYAQRFRIEKKGSYSELTISNPWQGATNIRNIYYLVRRGTPLPAGVDTSNIIFVPVRKIICMSTTYLSMISALGEENTIKGVAGADLIYDSELGKKAERGEIADVGYEDNLNKELVIQIDPDLIIVYGIGSEASGYLNKIKELGYRTLFNADYLETDPLGKAEWIKIFGALYCKEKEADDLFSYISKEYNRIRSFIREKNVGRPTVLLGLPWKDKWFVSPGNSYICALISDAGGNYLWKDVRSEFSMPYGIENVYMKALRADFWLNTGSVNSRSQIIAIDSRLGDLSSFRNGKIYNNNKRVTIRGGNDYWESGAINPQLILKDISAILHPGLFPGFELFYYKQIK